MKKITGIFGFLLLIMLFCGFKEKETISNQTEDNGIQIQALDNIEKIQLNTMRMDAKRYGKDRVSRIVDNIKSTVQVQEEKAREIYRGENYYTISLIYQDGTKDVFSFYEAQDEWYMETSDGEIYENAGFIVDCFGIKDVSTMDVSTMDGSGGTISLDWIESSKDILELGTQFDSFDLRYNFARDVRSSIGSGSIEDQAISFIRERWINEMKIYQYAVNEGYGISEEELTKRIERDINILESAANYEEAEKYYEEAGTTIRETLEKDRESYRISETINDMYSAKYEQFKNGQDEIAGKVYDDMRDYLNAFYMDIVFPEAENYDMSSFLQELDEAEEFYHEQFG